MLLEHVSTLPYNIRLVNNVKTLVLSLMFAILHDQSPLLTMVQLMAHISHFYIARVSS